MCNLWPIFSLKNDYSCLIVSIAGIAIATKGIELAPAKF